MSYTYNPIGEQVRRYQTANPTAAQDYYVYDEQGHWIGSYDVNGAMKQQIVWLEDYPVGLVNASGLKYIEPDHLGTPRAVIEVARNVAVWKWDAKSEAFGNSLPNENPDGDAFSLVFDMRFPGQRFDAATGMNYNYFRDYDAGTGRYAQSDPIGLTGGLSTYYYANNQSFGLIDQNGLSGKKKSNNFSPGGGGNSADRRRATRSFLRAGEGSLRIKQSESEDSKDGPDLPNDYVQYCTEVWCMVRCSKNKCMMYDRYEREYYVGGIPTVKEVQDKGCERKRPILKDWLPGQIANDSADWQDAVELASKLMSLRQSRVGK